MVWHSLFTTRPDQGPRILPENGVPVLVCRDHEVPSVGIRQGNLWFYGWPVAVWRQEGPRWWRKLGPEPDGYQKILCWTRTCLSPAGRHPRASSLDAGHRVRNRMIRRLSRHIVVKAWRWFGAPTVE